MVSRRCIYMIETAHNKKVYIGQTTRGTKKRWGIHLYELRAGIHKNLYLQRAFKKYGESNFKFTLLKCGDDLNLDQEEIRLIAQYKSNDSKYGYNLTSGGAATYKINPAIITKAQRKRERLWDVTLEKIKDSCARRKWENKINSILAYDPDTDFIPLADWEIPKVPRNRSANRPVHERAIAHPDGREWYDIYEASDALDLSFFNIFKALVSPEGCNGLKLKIR